MKTRMLNSMITGGLYLPMLESLESYQQSLRQTPTSKPKSACKQTFIITTALTALPSHLCKAV